MHGLAVLGQNVSGVGTIGDLVPFAVVSNVQQLGCLAVKDDAKAIGRGVRLGAQGEIGAAVYQNAVILCQKVLLFQSSRFLQQGLGGQLIEGGCLVAVQQAGGLGQTQAAAGLHSGSGAGCHAVVRQDLGRGGVAGGVDGRGLVRVSGGDSAREKQQAGKAQRCDLFSKHGILPSVRIGSAGVRLPAYTVSRRGIGSPDI